MYIHVPVYYVIYLSIYYLFTYSLINTQLSMIDLFIYLLSLYI